MNHHMNRYMNRPTIPELEKQMIEKIINKTIRTNVPILSESTILHDYCTVINISSVDDQNIIEIIDKLNNIYSDAKNISSYLMMCILNQSKQFTTYRIPAETDKFLQDLTTEFAKKDLERYCLLIKFG